MQVHGTLLMGFAQACMNLNIVAGANAQRLIAELEMGKWYPFSQLRAIEDVVMRSYQNSGPILVKVGMVMMHNWYQYGPGRSVLKGGASFLHYQTGSGGYQSVVQGAPEIIGTFDIEFYDRRRGRAVIHSTTPFSKDLERGVLIGGMSAPGDLDYVDVTAGEDSSFLHCEFH